MKSLLLMIAFSTLSTNALSFTQKDEIKKEHLKTLNQIKIEKGGIVQLEQFFKKELQTSPNTYRVEFICSKSRPKKTAKCKLVKYSLTK